MKNELTKYVEYLFALALKKCGDVNDAEDLTQETLLAAFQFINHGGTISNMKYWLTSVLSNKWNEELRKKYRLPLVSVDVIPDIEDICEDDMVDRPTLEEVRREVAYLAKLQREVIVMHYLEGKKVQDIADELNLPKGTVLSRLSSGRDQMRKGFDSMEQYEKQSYIPERLEVSCAGKPGFHEEPWSLVSEDLMKQNILIIAYKQPVTAIEIAKALGIPTPYVENAIEDLIKCELMIRNGKKVFTDFLISTPAERLSKLDIQLDFANQQYQAIWNLLAELFSDINSLSWFERLSDSEQIDLKYYAMIDVLSRGSYQAIKRIVDANEIYPERPDGGRWVAQGTRYDMNFDWKNYLASEYFYGGERVTHWDNFFSSKLVELHVYDTQPDLSKYEHGPVEIHDDNLSKLLYILYKGIPFKYTGFNLRYLEDIPHLASCGVLRYKNDKPQVAIPVLSKKEFSELFKISASYMVKLGDFIEEPLRNLFPQLKLEIPSHLEGRIAEFRKYVFYAFPMAIVKRAISDGDFVLDSQQKAIPMVLVIEEPENVIK
ncbi:MAG: RNA polymerase sigma factor [Clostridia bacterium]|nr:RNA polymerase sigma factor [Clostridia bacterium]